MTENSHRPTSLCHTAFSFFFFIFDVLSWPMCAAEEVPPRRIACDKVRGKRLFWYKQDINILMGFYLQWFVFVEIQV